MRFLTTLRQELAPPSLMYHINVHNGHNRSNPRSILLWVLRNTRIVSGQECHAALRYRPLMAELPEPAGTCTITCFMVKTWSFRGGTQNVTQGGRFPLSPVTHVLGMSGHPGHPPVR